jgi:hypothetical protein
VEGAALFASTNGPDQQPSDKGYNSERNNGYP